ncbi:L10-interacting MYB domain-containing protein, partial [Ananas comosus]
MKFMQKNSLMTQEEDSESYYHMQNIQRTCGTEEVWSQQERKFLGHPLAPYSMSQKVNVGNRPNTHFNRTRWQNVVNKFREKTNRAYDKIQLKNKWDSPKRD